MSESMLEQVKRMAQGLSLDDRVTLVDELAPIAWGKKQPTTNTGSRNYCAGPGAESFLRTLTSIQRFMKSGMNGKKNSWTLPPERRHRKALTADESLRRGHARAFVVSHKLATTRRSSERGL